MIKTNIWFGFIVIMTWIMISATNIDLFKTVAIKAGYLIFPEEGNKDIYILKSGEPLLLEQPGSYWMSYDGYMESRNNIHLMTSKAIEDGDFLMKMKLELDSCKSSVRIMAGDNQLGINLMSDDVPEGLYFEGPSLGKTIHKETDLKDILPTNKTITLEIWFEDDLIECKIEGISVLSASVVHKSFGRIGLNGWIEDGYFRVYEWIINAELVSLEQCYSRERLLNRAQRSVDLKAEEVKDDPNRPAYHIQPPANWNNDPNGTLFYNGYYHVFYQHNPFDDQWNWMHWGHVRSKNLVEWEI